MTKRVRTLSRRSLAATLRRLSLETLEQRLVMSATGSDLLLPQTNKLKSTINDPVVTMGGTTAVTASLTTTSPTKTRRNLKDSNLSVLPAAPAALLATAVSSSQVDLRWTDLSTNETGFRIERSAGTTGAWVQIATVGTNITTYSDTGLTASRGYQYRVRSTNPSGNSAYTAAVSVTTLGLLAPAAPLALKASAMSSTDIQLAWVDNSTNESGFEVDRATAGTNQWMRVGSVQRDVTTFWDSGLTAATTYDYRVRAINGVGTSGYSTSSETTAVPPKPQVDPMPRQMKVADVAPPVGSTGAPGFSVHDVVIVRAGMTADAGTTLQVTISSVTKLDANTTLMTYRTPNGEATISARLTLQGNDRLMEVTVSAGAEWDIRSIMFGAPHIYTVPSNDLRIFTPFLGGSVQPWLQDQWTAQGTAAWPNMNYSPLVVFYNQATTEGVGLVSFDGGFEQRTLFWVSGPGEIHPYVRWDCNIRAGKSQDTTLQQHHAFNMPKEEFGFYHDNILKPYMDSQGISEGTMAIDGMMGWSDGTVDGNVGLTAAKAQRLGASGYLQYAPGDGAQYFEANPETLSWYPTLQQAGQLPGLESLGVLINPTRASRSTSPTTDRTSPLWFPDGGGPISLADPDVQNFLNRLKNDLASRGVNFAFWDTGTGGPPGEGRLWFELLKSWKEAGISIAAENSCDIASYVTGTNLFWKWQDGKDYTLVKTVTPRAKIVYLETSNMMINGTYWWDKAAAEGFIPLLHFPQMEIWAAQRGLV